MTNESEFEELEKRVKKLEDQIDIWKRTAPLTDKEGRPNLVRSFLDIEKRVEKLEESK